MSSRPAESAVLGNGNVSDSKKETFGIKFQKLVLFVERHDGKFPTTREEEGGLGSWVKDMRKHYKDYSIAIATDSTSRNIEVLTTDTKTKSKTKSKTRNCYFMKYPDRLRELEGINFPFQMSRKTNSTGKQNNGASNESSNGASNGASQVALHAPVHSTTTSKINTATGGEDDSMIHENNESSEPHDDFLVDFEIDDIMYDPNVDIDIDIDPSIFTNHPILPPLECPEQEQPQEDPSHLHNPQTSALLLILQPSSAPLSSHLRLRANLDIIKDNIESRGELNGCSIVLGGGSYVESIGHKSDICIICADGIDECVARKGYIENLVKEISPKVVVICMRYGAKRVGEMLRKAGVKNILWMKIDVLRLEMVNFFKVSLLPFCKALLVERERIVSAFDTLRNSVRQERLISHTYDDNPDGTESTWWGVHCSKKWRPRKNTLDRHSQPIVQIQTRDFDQARMYGFDYRSVLTLSNYAINLKWVDTIRDTLMREQDSLRRGNRFINVHSSVDKGTKLGDLALSICLSAGEDESLLLDGIYRVASKASKDDLYSQVEKLGNVLVFIDSVNQLFTSTDEFCTWIRTFRGIPITFLFVSSDNDFTEDYLNQLEDVEGEVLNVHDSPRLYCDKTDVALDCSRFQGTIKLIPTIVATDEGLAGIERLLGKLQIFSDYRKGSDGATCLSSSFDDSWFVQLKDSIAKVANTVHSCIEIYFDDDGAMQIQLGIKNVQNLKKLLDALIINTSSYGIAQQLASKPIKISIEHMVALYEDAALQLNTLNNEQIFFLQKMWKSNIQRMHIRGSAGTGKTFLALHCTLEYLTNTDNNSTRPRRVLFVCPSLSLCFHFARWMLSRLKRNPYVRKRILDQISFFVYDSKEGTWETIRIESCSNGDLTTIEIDLNEKTELGLVIIDEGHELFNTDISSNVKDAIVPLIQPNRDDCRMIILSDISQSSSIDDKIVYPSTEKEYDLISVSRCSNRIILASAPFQLGEKPSCNHDIQGPKVKLDLFEAKWPLFPSLMNTYADKIVNALHDINGLLEGADLHKRIAIAVPNAAFRANLMECLIQGTLEPFNLTAVTALEAMQKRGKGKNWIIIDNESNLKGLEFLFIIAAGLDRPFWPQTPVVRTGFPSRSKRSQASIYRAISRAHLGAYILNQNIPDGWLHWLHFTRPYEENEQIDFDSELDRIDRNATASLVTANKRTIATEEELSGRKRQCRIGMIPETQLRLRTEHEKLQRIKSKSSFRRPLPVDISIAVDAFDTSSCERTKLLMSRKPSFLPFRSKHISYQSDGIIEKDAYSLLC